MRASIICSCKPLLHRFHWFFLSFGILHKVLLLFFLFGISFLSIKNNTFSQGTISREKLGFTFFFKYRYHMYRVSQKFAIHYNFWSKLYFYMKFLEDVYFSISTCIQNFSNGHALFVFVFCCFGSRCGMKWDTACRPTNDLFWTFYHLVRRSTSKTIFVEFRQLKKAFIQKRFAISGAF